MKLTSFQLLRTIWGQDFDGTANVTGNMSTVGDITFSGAQTISTGGNNALTFNTGTATFHSLVTLLFSLAVQSS